MRGMFPPRMNSEVIGNNGGEWTERTSERDANVNRIFVMFINVLFRWYFLLNNVKRNFGSYKI